MEASSKKIIGILGLLVLSGWVWSQQPLANDALVEALKREISGERAFRYTAWISQFDRIQASPGWHEAARMIQNKLKQFGYKDVVLEGWPSDGSQTYSTYRSPIGWQARKAELWMISPEKERLCSFQEMPLTLVKHSHAADVEAELVDVGSGVGDASYTGKDVRGKIVLATAYTGTVVREAVLKRGALGVVTWYPPEVRPGYPDMVRYTAIWPRWEEREKVGFGFNVSKQQGWRLKRALEGGQKVVLKAFVDAEFFNSKIEVLSAALHGSDRPEKEVLIIGHLCHPEPSANDNASGSGGMLEMARALKYIVDLGLVESPRRTIRFLWVPEFNGTMPYVLAHLERTRNTLAAINCDMIGEDLHLTGGTFNITCTPDSMPSFLNDVVVDFSRLVERLGLQSINGSRHPFLCRVLPFSGGSDHYIFNDGSLKVPSVMLGHGDIFHHTSLDTIDKVDSSELRRVCFIALGTALYLAHASDDEALAMAHLVSRNGIGRYAGDYYESLWNMMRAATPSDLERSYRQTRSVAEHSEKREKEAVLSTCRFASTEETFQRIRRMVSPLERLKSYFLEDLDIRYAERSKDLNLEPTQIPSFEDEARWNRIIPHRAEEFIGPLDRDYVEQKLGKDAFKGVDLGQRVAYEALNFADGARSLREIAEAVSAEFGPVSPAKIYAYFQVLERAGLLFLKER